MGKLAIFLDGGFVRKKLSSDGGGDVTADRVASLCDSIVAHQALDACQLLRIYWYDALPFEGKGTHPLTGKTVNFARTPQAIASTKLIQGLELRPNFAVRKGILMMHGWKLGPIAIKRHRQSRGKPLEENDLVPHLEQKGVDMRVGLDIARIAIRRTADILVLVTGDSDFVPAMKLARIEGLRVFLHSMGHPVNRELKVHADLVF